MWYGVVVAGVFAAALQAEGHHRAHVALRDVDGGPDVGLLDAGNTGRIGEIGGIVHLQDALVLQMHQILDRGHGQNQRNVELALQPLLHHLQMQEVLTI